MSANITSQVISFIRDSAAQATPFVENAAIYAAPYIGNATEKAGQLFRDCFQYLDGFVREHIDDLDDYVPKNFTQKFNKEWAETIPIAILLIGTGYAGYKAISSSADALAVATRKTLKAAAWVGVAAVTSTALLLSIKNTNIAK